MRGKYLNNVDEVADIIWFCHNFYMFELINFSYKNFLVASRFKSEN
jgi:hypothetical protein